MSFSFWILLSVVLIWPCAITMGILLDGKSLNDLGRLFRTGYKSLLFLCYGLGILPSVLAIPLGVILGTIAGMMIVDPLSDNSLVMVGYFTVGGMFFCELSILFLWGRIWNRKIFSLPPP